MEIKQSESFQQSLFICFDSFIQIAFFRIIEAPESPKKLYFKKQYKTKSEILCVRFDHEDQLLATGNLDGTIQIFHLQMNSQSISWSIQTPENPTPCTCLRWRPPNLNNKSVITSGDGLGNVIRWHTTSGRELDRVVEKDNQILCMDYDSCGQYLATAGKDCIIKVYDELNKVQEYQLVGNGFAAETSHQNRIFSVKFIPESSNVLISGSWDQNINIWDLRQQKCAGSFLAGKICGDSVDCKNNKILVGMNQARDQLKLFDLRERKLIQEIDYDKEKRENGAFIYGAQFQKNNEGTIAVCSSGKNELKIFNEKNNYEPIGGVFKFSKGLYSMDYGNMSGMIAMGGGEGLAVVVSQISK